MHGRVKVRTSAEQEKLQKEKHKQLVDEFERCFVLARSNCWQNSPLQNDIELTTRALELSPDTYTIWNTRRTQILESLKHSASNIKTIVARELELTTLLLKEQPKSYATWFHRKWCIQKDPTPDWESEINFCASMLAADARNFHCWSYRCLSRNIGHISADSELAYTTEEIEKNFSNYSAWHQRGKLMSALCNIGSIPLLSPPPHFEDSSESFFDFKDEQSDKELQAIQNSIFTDPADQSPWMHYIFLLSRGPREVYIREFFISRTLERIVLVFTSAKLLSDLKQIGVSIEVTPSNSKQKSSYLTLSAEDLGGWQSALDGVSSAVWWLPISRNDVTACAPDSERLLYASKIGIKATLSIPAAEDSTETICQTKGCTGIHLFCLTCILPEDQNESLTRVDLDPRRLLNVISPKVEPASLADQIIVIRDLLEMEPQTRMANIVLIHLLRFSNPPKAAQDIEKSLTLLTKTDTLRRRYYICLKSQLSIQDALIELYRTHSRQLTLRSLGLTTLHYADWMALVTSLDLSGNRLTRLPDTAAYLVCLSDLNLDDNRIVSMDGVSQLPSLRRLSVRRNRLASMADIADLLRCPVLTTVALDDNAVTSIAGLSHQLATHPNASCKKHSFNVTYSNNTLTSSGGGSNGVKCDDKNNVQ